MPPLTVDGKFQVVDVNGNPILTIDPDSSFIQINYCAANGLHLMQATNTASLNLFGSNTQILSPGGAEQFGARLDGSIATLFLGGNGTAGKIFINDATKKQIIVLDASVGSFTMTGTDAQLALFPSAATSTGDPHHATIHLRASDGTVRTGGAGSDGHVYILSKDDKSRITLDGGRAYGALGGDGWDGGFALFPAAATSLYDWKQATMTFNGKVAAVIMGGNGADANITLKDASGKDAIELNAKTGDIYLQNADCAEDFDIAESERVEPGTVVMLDGGGALRQSREAYDKKVAGVISGAGEYKPGIVLDKRRSPESRLPVALMGKVFCKLDAQYSRVEVGDLLTTSDTPGHAMKAQDPSRAFGAVLGKALRQLRSGQGLIPVLVTLQ